MANGKWQMANGKWKGGSVFPGANTPRPFAICHLPSCPSARLRRGFTLVEVLATMMLIAIVLPAVMQGVAVATRAGAEARRRTEAAGLASSKLAELIATGQWQGGVMAGDFSPDWPDYRWQATVGNWSADTSNVGLQEVDLSVFWIERGQQNSVRVSTLTYVRPTSQ